MTDSTAIKSISAALILAMAALGAYVIPEAIAIKDQGLEQIEEIKINLDAQSNELKDMIEKSNAIEAQ